MSKLTISEFNCELGEIVVRDFTKEEINQIAIDEAAAAKELADKQAKTQAKAALLKRLGITADEAALLLG
jgi:hypothetical protein